MAAPESNSSMTADTPAPAYTIRPATEADVLTILALINELADYEHELKSVQATEETLLATLSFPSNPSKRLRQNHPHYASRVHVPGWNGLYFHNYSTWRAAPGIFLEDLYVQPAYRGRGYGKALIQALARECVRLKCGRLEWSVLKWNEPSIKFYQSEAIGATRMEEWVGMRVDGEELVRLAGAK